MNRRFQDLLVLLLLGLSIALAPLACSSDDTNDGSVDSMTRG